MKKLTVKESARQFAAYRKALDELRGESSLRIASIESPTGIQLGTSMFLKLQKDTCADVKFVGRGSIDFPIEAYFEFEGEIFFVVLDSDEIKKFKEMGFDVSVKGSDY